MRRVLGGRGTGIADPALKQHVASALKAGWDSIGA
jgi:hypothetical protein